MCRKPRLTFGDCIAAAAAVGLFAVCAPASVAQIESNKTVVCRLQSSSGFAYQTGAAKWWLSQPAGASVAAVTPLWIRSSDSICRVFIGDSGFVELAPASEIRLSALNDGAARYAAEIVQGSILYCMRGNAELQIGISELGVSAIAQRSETATAQDSERIGVVEAFGADAERTASLSSVAGRLVARFDEQSETLDEGGAMTIASSAPIEGQTAARHTATRSANPAAGHAFGAVARQSPWRVVQTSAAQTDLAGASAGESAKIASEPVSANCYPSPSSPSYNPYPTYPWWWYPWRRK